MANAAGMIKESIWRDKDFRALPRTAQATYCELVSQKDLDRAGIQPLQVTKWAKGCDEITEADVWADLKVLEEQRFVFYDEDTDELFVRSYMRHCEITRYPNILKNALRCATLVASEKLRAELATELRRLRRAEANRVADQIDAEPPNGSETKTNPSETLPRTVPEPLNPSETLTEPQGYGTGSGTVTLVSNHLGEAPPPSPFCAKHPNGTNDSCPPCGRARHQRADWETNQNLAKVQARQHRLAAIAACPDCDEAGWITDPSDPDGALIRCTHPRIQP